MTAVAQVPAGALDVRRLLGWVALATAIAVAVVGLSTPATTAARDAAATGGPDSAGAAPAPPAPPTTLVARLPAPAPAPPATAAVHEVASGDTLSAIAAANGVTVGALRAANDLDGDALAVGQRLLVPEATPERDATS